MNNMEVSQTPGFLNSGCLSEPDKCISQGYSKQGNYGNVVVDGLDSTSGCWDQWIYGYSDNFHLGGEIIKNVSDPAKCQQICQEREDCASFSWRGLGTWDIPEGNCLLKTYDLAKGALNQIINNQQSIDANYCNVTIGAAHYKMLDCDGTVRCVWQSDMHVSGPKFCSSSRDECHINPKPENLDTTTLAPASTDMTAATLVPASTDMTAATLVPASTDMSAATLVPASADITDADETTTSTAESSNTVVYASVGAAAGGLAIAGAAYAAMPSSAAPSPMAANTPTGQSINETPREQHVEMEPNDFL